ncbi:PREDICTED: ATP-dependent DNA helicase PIF4-like [Ipomoea nil]|uniref:ATP-dependent DNA helicase PIF4-like n=1 Tax=Ipomoea nil TaxID=35883 RepID=UPI0009008714|nr:PREDICTED: ATP-dependent DNA helicase PIF4-like [Ipomoea nil]
MNDIDSNGGRLFFVYGYKGTGKTFVWRTLSSKIRSREDIVLNVASSGIASLFLLGGRTAHSRFVIPLSLNGDSTCNISQGSDLCELIIRSKLIIWDEALLTHKYYFEALDKAMRGLLRFTIPGSAEKIFSGKTVVLGGDFRQILPVIPKATRLMIVGATINSSYIWKNYKVLRLTKNLRLRSLASDEDRHTVDWFSKWIANIGGRITGFVNNDL